jgi:uncharacterized membrane protein YqjE
MSTREAELPGEDVERTWRSRFDEVASASRVLLATRLAIFREEAAVKAGLAARGVAGIVLGLAFGVGALLLTAALLAAILVRLTNSVVLGILLAAVLYAAAAGACAWIAMRALLRVRPLEFPETTAELARDWDAVAATLAPEPEPVDEGSGAALPADEESVADLEARLRGGPR